MTTYKRVEPKNRKRVFSPKVKLEFMEAKDLYIRLNNTNTSNEIKDKIKDILADREAKGKPVLDAFFDSTKNKFLNLAKWQLYREGKARVYGHGKYLRFSIDDPIMLFDKMLEVKDAYDNYRIGKSKDQRQLCDSVREELQVWKR